MRLAIVAFCCLLLAGVLVAQVTPSVRQSLCTVSGQVVQQPGGTPLKKVMVSLAPAQGASTDDGGQQQYAAVTDAEGHFQIDGVQPREYRVTLERNGFVATHHRSRTYSSTSLSLTAGQEITNLLLPMVPAGVIQGRVFDEDGDPAPNVGVFVFSAAGSAIPANATTNDLGDYRIAGLAGGEYFVMAQAEREPIEATKKPDEPRIYAPTFYPGTTDKRRPRRLKFILAMRLVPISTWFPHELTTYGALSRV